MTTTVNQTGDLFCSKLAEQCKCKPEGFDVTEYVLFSFCSQEKFEDITGVTRNRVHPKSDNTMPWPKKKTNKDLQNITQKTEKDRAQLRVK